MWKIIKVFILFSLVYSPVNAQESLRRTIDLCDSWTMYPAYNVNADVEKTKVHLPHTWNAENVFGKIDYYRGTMVYQRSLSLGKELVGKRLFLYFEGVNSVANVFVDGKLIGEHLGGYTAFCFEITDYITLGKEAIITVLVSNAYRTDVLPLSGDFNVYGGIHRPVYLLTTGKDCISPLDYASSGVYIKPQNVSGSEAKFIVETKLSLNGKCQDYKVRTTVIDARLQIVKQGITSVSSHNMSEANQEFSITNPVLWDGKKNPYCYQVKVELLENDKVIDVVTETTGFRYFSVDAEKGFYLNGRYLDLHGFGIHEDIAGKGSAYTPDDYITDMSLVKESGATAIRLTHYPHGKMIYNLSDKEGIAIWTEIPFVGPGGYTGTGYINSTDLKRNTKNMLIEMIRQNYNHPSVFFWGLLNELKFDCDNPIPFVKELNNLAKKEDPSRLTTCASFGDQMEFVGITDLIGWNEYFGWYGGIPSEIGTFVDKMKANAKGTPICVTEYGAGASITDHQCPVEKPDAGGNFHPEEWQVVYHEGNWRELSTRKFVWAKFVWNFADFGSSIRNEGSRQGINDKGLITYDRKTKKDAFYFYKANWNPDPMVYITSKRHMNRYNPLTDVKVFTNAKQAELLVKGKKISIKKPDSLNTISWKNIKLKPGENNIEVKAKFGKQQLTDSCRWILTEGQIH